MWAQVPDDIAIGPSSPTGDATNDIFGTDVNDYLDPVNWSGVEYDKFFGFLGYAGSPNLGFVTKVGSISLGAYYTGTAVAFGQTQTSEVEVTYDTNGEELSRVTTASNSDPFVNTNNTLGILIGLGPLGPLGGLGINVGLRENMYGAAEYRNNFYTGTPLQKDITTYVGGAENGYKVSDFSWTTGVLTPVISVGTSLPIAAWELKPRLDLAFGFNFGNAGAAAPVNTNVGTGSFVHETYRSVNGVDTARTKVEYTANRLVFNPVFSLGADLDFAPGIGPSLFVDGGLNFHGEDYGVVTKTTNYLVSPTQTQVIKATTGAYDEWRELQLVIRPAYRYSLGLGDRVTLGLLGGVDVDLASHLYKPGNSTVTTTTYTFPDPANNYTQTLRVMANGTQEEMSQVTVTPQAVAAIQFAAIPNRLTLNAGVKATLPAFTTTSTKSIPLQGKTVMEIERADGTREEYVSAQSFTGQDTMETENSWGAFQWTFGAGFGFLFNETFGADLKFTTSSFTNLNVSALGLLFTVKR
jgi:hypothetical protein